MPLNAIGIPRRNEETLAELKFALSSWLPTTDKDRAAKATTLKLLREVTYGLVRYKLVARAYVILQANLAAEIDKLEFDNKPPMFPVLATAVFMQESQGKRLAKGYTNVDGTFDWGSEQLNSIHFPNEEAHQQIATDYYKAAQFGKGLMVRRIAKNQFPLIDWVGFTKGRYVDWWDVALEATTWLDKDDKPRALL